ncbi:MULTISPECIES: bestrophin-like domain [unclassified Blastococcus]
MLFFGVSTWVLALLLGGLMAGATVTGLVVGRRLSRGGASVREPFSVLQGVLVGFMGLVLAFGLSLALGRYETRRAATVDEANAIGTAYLRAQTLAEPVRTESLELLRAYTRTSIAIADTVPGSDAQARALAESDTHQRALWALAGQALADAPVDSAPRLYVETLNESFDAQSARVYALGNRVPTAVLVVEVVGAAVALGALALQLGLHLETLGRGLAATLAAAGLVTVLLVVTFDLDRPTRGSIRVPDTPLSDVLVTISEPPAAAAPD